MSRNNSTQNNQNKPQSEPTSTPSLDAVDATARPVEEAPTPAPAPIAETQEEDDSDVMFGNKDSKKSTPFPKAWKNEFVVRQSEARRLEGTDEYAEVSSSVRAVPYDKATFEAMKKNGGFEGLQVTILNEPSSK